MLRGGVWELYGGVLAQARSRDTLVFRQIPSKIKGLQEREWECVYDFAVRDFGMDPAQDLLASIELPNEEWVSTRCTSSGLQLTTFTLWSVACIASIY